MRKNVYMVREGLYLSKPRRYPTFDVYGIRPDVHAKAKRAAAAKLREMRDNDS